MAEATLSISSRNYSSWSLRGWLICKMSGLDFETEMLSGSDPSARAELLHLSPSFLVPRLVHGEVRVWDTLAIAQYLNEVMPESGLLPTDKVARAWCRSVSGEMHQGFVNLRSALPMNLKSRHPDFKVWGGALSDVERITTMWSECLARHRGPWLFGATPTLADAMYAPSAPVSSPTAWRFRTRAPPTATTSWPGRSSPNGSRRRRPSPRTSKNSTWSSDAPAPRRGAGATPAGDLCATPRASDRRRR